MRPAVPTAALPGRSRLGRLLLGVGLGGALAACSAGEPTPPDVVLIDVDSVRADHVGHLGHVQPTTRGIDAFRGKAALFAAARSPSSASAAGSASLLTGLSPARLRMGGETPRLPPGPATLAGTLGDAGWSSIGLSHHPGISAETGFARGFDSFQSARGDPLDHPDGGAMVDWLREWLAHDPPRPFFLYLHPMDPHPPYRVPPGARGALLGRPPSDAMPYDGALMRAARQPLRRRAREAIGDREVQSLVEQYDTAVHYAFVRVGQMLALLEQAGRLDGALVVIASNHGQELFERGGFDHGRTLYEEVLRVPLYVKLPGAAEARRFDQRVSTLDVMPTLLDLLGLPAPPVDGVSLAPLLRGEADALPERDFVHGVQPGGPLTLRRALLRGRHKLIEKVGGPELYDLALDPGERNDLADANREMVLELRRALSRIYPLLPPDAPRPAPATASGARGSPAVER